MLLQLSDLGAAMTSVLVPAVVILVGMLIFRAFKSPGRTLLWLCLAVSAWMAVEYFLAGFNDPLTKGHLNPVAFFSAGLSAVPLFTVMFAYYLEIWPLVFLVFFAGLLFRKVPFALVFLVAAIALGLLGGRLVTFDRAMAAWFPSLALHSMYDALWVTWACLALAFPVRFARAPFLAKIFRVTPRPPESWPSPEVLKRAKKLYPLISEKDIIELQAERNFLGKI